MVRSVSIAGRAKVLGAFAISLLLSLAAFTVSAVRAAESGMASPAISEAEPARIVALGGAVTEIIYALGAGGNVIAADITSLYPADARQLPKVGYFRQVAAEPIIAMNPGVILAIEDAGPKDVLRQIEEAGVKLVTIPDETSAEGVLEKVEAVGRALGRPAEAAALKDRIAAEFDVLAGVVAKAESKPKVAVLLSAGKGAPMAGGSPSSAEGIVSLAGGTNAFQEFSDWKPVSAESLIAAAPEVIVVPDHVARAVGGVEGIAQMPGVTGTPAGREARIVVLDSLLLLGFGPRTPEAARKLAAELHPELAGELAAKAEAIAGQ